MATPIYTTSNGAPVANPEAAQRIGNNGPLLLQDFALIDLLAHFDRERIPERVVHAKGAGAYGHFTVTHDVSDICAADFLSEVGKVTNVVVRFSTVGGEKGSADSARDPRGFSVKFYTNEGNYDWVFNNTPIFFIRDPALFPLLIHTQKRNPQTNLKDATMFWDYFNTHQESVHQVMHTFSDRGTPRGYAYMNGYSGHTYKFVNRNGDFSYVQIHVKTDQGINNLTNDEAVHLAGTRPDFATQDLFNSIKAGNFPSYTVYVQVLSAEDAKKFKWNIFDLTKVWPHSEVPLRQIGKLGLNRNPENYFAEIEQVAFSPGHLVPGIEASADPVLQSRLFSYADSQRHRLGVNYQQIPVNQPLHPAALYQRDGFMSVLGNYGSKPNYPSSVSPAMQYDKQHVQSKTEEWNGHANSFKFGVQDEDFDQPRMLWEVLGKQEGQQDHLVYNIKVHLKDAVKEVREATYDMFGRVDQGFGQWLRKDTEVAAAMDEGEARVTY